MNQYLEFDANNGVGHGFNVCLRKFRLRHELWFELEFKLNHKYSWIRAPDSCVYLSLSSHSHHHLSITRNDSTSFAFSHSIYWMRAHCTVLNTTPIWNQLLLSLLLSHSRFIFVRRLYFEPHFPWLHCSKIYIFITKAFSSTWNHVSDLISLF